MVRTKGRNERGQWVTFTDVYEVPYGASVGAYPPLSAKTQVTPRTGNPASESQASENQALNRILSTSTIMKEGTYRVADATQRDCSSKEDLPLRRGQEDTCGQEAPYVLSEHAKKLWHANFVSKRLKKEWDRNVAIADENLGEAVTDEIAKRCESPQTDTWRAASYGVQRDYNWDELAWSDHWAEYWEERGHLCEF